MEEKFFSLKWTQEEPKWNRSMHMEQTVPNLFHALQLAKLINKTKGAKLTSSNPPLPQIGDRVTFHQGILRTGRIISLGRKRASVSFQYKNGKTGTSAIPYDKLTKLPGIGWEASLYWNK
jgi:hypothetical protein